MTSGLWLGPAPAHRIDSPAGSARALRPSKVAGPGTRVPVPALLLDAPKYGDDRSQLVIGARVPLSFGSS